MYREETENDEDNDAVVVVGRNADPSDFFLEPRLEVVTSDGWLTEKLPALTKLWRPPL